MKFELSDVEDINLARKCSLLIVLLADSRPRQDILFQGALQSQQRRKRLVFTGSVPEIRRHL